MSIRKQIHDAIENVLKEANFQWIDMWKSQVGNQKEEYPLNFPAGFISIKKVQYEDLTVNQKEGTTIIEVLLFFDVFGDTFQGAVDKEESFEIYDTIEQVAEQIHWITGDNFSEITQVGEDDLTSTYERPAISLTFETMIYKKINRDNYVYTEE